MNTNNKLIFDIGMHKGEDAITYLKKGFTLIGIEASPVLCEENAKKFKNYIDDGRLIIENIGIAPKAGTIPFYINHRLTEWSSFSKELGSRNNTTCHEVQVPAVTTSYLFEKYGIPFYLKVDIEGYDLHCLVNLYDDKRIPQYIPAEASSIECIDILYKKGYSKFKLINQADNFNSIDLNRESKSWYPRYLIVKNGIKLRIQKLISLPYPYGSSGPFAEETKGNWKSYEEIRNLYTSFMTHNHGKALNAVSWFDVHATF